MIIDFGGVKEDITTREEFPLDKAKKTLEDEVIAVIGYGVQGPAQSMNMRDNGFNVIVGQSPDFKADWEKALADGWEPGKTLFPVEEAVQKGTIVQYLVSDAAQKILWPDSVKPNLREGSALYFSHGFSIVYRNITGVVPPDNVDVIMVAPKGAGASVRENFVNGMGINSSYAIEQDFTGKSLERTLALGIGIGSGYLFPTTFEKEVFSDLTGERAVLLGELWAIAEASYSALIERGRSRYSAFINSSEQLTQVILPLIGKAGVNPIYEQAREKGELGTVKVYQDAAREAAAPIMKRLYQSVADGTEPKIVLRENSKPDYAERLKAELSAIDNAPMWKVGVDIRRIYDNDRKYNEIITNFGLAGAVLGIMEAQYGLFIEKGHSPSEAFNETVEELTESLNRFYQRNGVASLIGNCSSTAQRGALDWGPVFREAHLPVFMGLKNHYDNTDNFDPRNNYTALKGPNMWVVGEKVRSLRPENQAK